MKSVYTFYKERLIEISGKNRSLYLKNFNKKNGYDVGKILYNDQEKAVKLLSLLWCGNSENFELIGKSTRESIIKSSDINIRYEAEEDIKDENERARVARQRREYSKKVIATEIQNLRTLKREIDEIEKDTGRYELYFCYPFVCGNCKNYNFKAPLFMFPIELSFPDDSTVNISFKAGERIQLNRALMYAIADSYRLNLDEMEMEFTSLSKFSGIQAVLDYLKKFGVRISFQSRKHVFPFNRYGDINEQDELEVKNLCILSRISLANAIYADYTALEKRNLTNDAINELLNTRVIKRRKEKCSKLYLINNVDFAQQQVIQKVNENGNMVIYGPPGTGKSQTIVNIISDALAKNKKVLVVSQKRAALDVIYNRLGNLNIRAMLMTDPAKELQDFYTKSFSSHEALLKMNYNKELFVKYDNTKLALDNQIKNLNELSNFLNNKTDFGISLQEMYYNSYKIGKSSIEYEIYTAMQKDLEFMKLDYDTLSDSLSTVYGKNNAEMYYDFVESKKANPFIDYLRGDLSIHVVAGAQSKLKQMMNKKQTYFDVGRYKYCRQILTYYNDVKSNKDITPLTKLIASLEYPQLNQNLKLSKVIFPMYPFAKVAMSNKEKEIQQEIERTIKEIDEYVVEYEFLKEVLTENGYLMAINGIVNGNNETLKLVAMALDNYVEYRDITTALHNLKDAEKTILNFAYKNSNSYQKYSVILSKILPVRIYFEIIKIEDEHAETLSAMVDFDNIRAKILALTNELCDISKQIAKQGFLLDYQKLFEAGKENKDYLYQISKKQNYWPIRKVVDIYQDYMLKLFPCWLLSPENVSTVLPLTKNLFDIVLFDEASQVFIENTIPSVYRGNCVVVAGDAKQLRPPTTFMKRYMGATIDDNMDYSTQAALEVESLLDLAVSRFENSHINYHYRSRHEELIDYSNKAFYNNTLQIAPNVSKNLRNKPLERILVDGLWDDRKNMVEAKSVVKLLKTVLKNRKNKETIGIITFNVEQENCIEDLIDQKCLVDDTTLKQIEWKTVRTKACL